MNESKRCIVFVVWGQKHVRQLQKQLKGSRLPDGDVVLVTDLESEIDESGLVVIRRDLTGPGLHKKVEGMLAVPEQYELCLFLDTDITMLDEVELGFEKAQRHGMAMAAAPHYSLDDFFGFDEIMKAEGVPCSSQLHYNTGVIFFQRNNAEVRKVFERWLDLCRKYEHMSDSDQPYLTLVMEQMQFNPYTLSNNYNCRPSGQILSGKVRVWHSTYEIPENINRFEKSWPPRRITKHEVIPPEKSVTEKKSWWSSLKD